MNWLIPFYYLGYSIALFLCWNLGPLFRIPMLINAGFNLCLNLGLFAEWDIRLLIMSHGLAFFFWVLALSQEMGKATFAFVLLLDLAFVYNGMYPQLAVMGSGPEFWHWVSTEIIQVWMLSIAGVVGSMVLQSTVLARWKGRRIDLLANPKKRFLLPIGVWALAIVLSSIFRSQLSPWLAANRFSIAAQLLAWGWVGLELPHYLAYRRLTRQQ